MMGGEEQGREGEKYLSSGNFRRSFMEEAALENFRQMLKNKDS